MTESTTWKQPSTRLALGLAALVAGIVAAWWLGAFELLSTANADRLGAVIEGLGWWAPAAFVLLWVAASVLFLPGLPITIVGGLVFGAVWGTVWTTVGANLGAAAAFLIGRYLARDAIERRVASSETLKRIDDGVRRLGWRMVLVTRLVPIFPFNVQNYVYGLTDIKLSTFVAVSVPAMLPATIAYTFAAGSLRTGDTGRTLWLLGIAAVLLVLLSFAPSRVAARFADDEHQSQD